MAETANRLLTLTAEIAMAFLGANSVPATAVPDLLSGIHRALADLEQNLPEEPTEARSEASPAVKIQKSVFADHLVCLEDGLSMKLLKRHLLNVHGMTPNQYRNKWGLPKNYPMVAPDYAKRRSEMAKESGLGRRR